MCNSIQHGPSAAQAELGTASKAQTDLKERVAAAEAARAALEQQLQDGSKELELLRKQLPELEVGRLGVAWCGLVWVWVIVGDVGVGGWLAWLPPCTASFCSANAQRRGHCLAFLPVARVSCASGPGMCETALRCRHPAAGKHFAAHSHPPSHPPTVHTRPDCPARSVQGKLEALSSQAQSLGAAKADLGAQVEAAASAAAELLQRLGAAEEARAAAEAAAAGAVAAAGQAEQDLAARDQEVGGPGPFTRVCCGAGLWGPGSGRARLESGCGDGSPSMPVTRCKIRWHLQSSADPSHCVCVCPLPAAGRAARRAGAAARGVRGQRRAAGRARGGGGAAAAAGGAAGG